MEIYTATCNINAYKHTIYILRFFAATNMVNKHAYVHIYMCIYTSLQKKIKTKIVVFD